MRSIFAFVAAMWFLYNALTFLPWPAYANPGAPGGIDAADGGAVAVTWAARALFGGLVPLALALIAWERIFAFFRTEPREKSDEPSA